MNILILILVYILLSDDGAPAAPGPPPASLGITGPPVAPGMINGDVPAEHSSDVPLSTRPVGTNFVRAAAAAINASAPYYTTPAAPLSVTRSGPGHF
jgi:hypothetical protein